MSDLTDDAWAEGLGAPMTTDLEAAVARLKRDLDAIAAETPGAREARGDVRLLLADWQRQGKMLDVCSVVHDHNVKLKAERDAARAELARLRERDARMLEWVETARKRIDFVSGTTQNPQWEHFLLELQQVLSKPIALLKETP